MPDRLFGAFKNMYVFLCATDFDSFFQPKKGENYFPFPSCRVTTWLPLNSLFPEQQQGFLGFCFFFFLSYFRNVKNKRKLQETLVTLSLSLKE